MFRQTARKTVVLFTTLRGKMFSRKLAVFCRTFKLPVPVQSARNVYMYSPEPFHPIPDREPKLTTAEEAVSVITTGNNIICVLDLEKLRFSFDFVYISCKIRLQSDL